MSDKPRGYYIASPKCGRDKRGAFHCRCGKCRPLTYEGKDGRDSRDNGGDGGNNADGRGNDKSALLSPRS